MHALRAVVLPSLMVSLIALARPASADQTARLVYGRAHGAGACPDETALRGAVAARLGYDPFRAVAPLTVIANVTRANGAFHGDIRLLGAEGDEVGSRTIGSGSERCEEVIAALALSISVAIDPTLLTRPLPLAATPADLTPPAPPPPAPVAPPLMPSAVVTSRPAPALPPPRSSPPAPDPARPDPFLIAAVIGSVGSAPSPAFGFAAGGGYRRGVYSIAVEARADLPSPTVAYTGAELSSFLVLGSVVPCLHYSVAFGCVVGSAGVLTATSSAGLANPATDRAVYGAIGPRLGAELPLTRHAHLRASLDLGVPLSRNPYAVGGVPLYTPLPVWVALAVGVAYHL